MGLQDLGMLVPELRALGKRHGTYKVEAYPRSLFGSTQALSVG